MFFSACTAAELVGKTDGDCDGLSVLLMYVYEVVPSWAPSLKPFSAAFEWTAAIFVPLTTTTAWLTS